MLPGGLAKGNRDVSSAARIQGNALPSPAVNSRQPSASTPRLSCAVSGAAGMASGLRTTQFEVVIEGVEDGEHDRRDDGAHCHLDDTHNEHAATGEVATGGHHGR